MAVRSLGWLGVRTPAADAMNAFYRDVLHLEVILERPGATWFRLQDGTEVHVYGSDDEDHDFFGTAPVVGLAVDSFRAAYAALAGARAAESAAARTADPGHFQRQARRHRGTERDAADTGPGSAASPLTAPPATRDRQLRELTTQQPA